MDVTRPWCTILANSRLNRSIARRLDEFISQHELSRPSVQRTLQNVYGAHIFASSVLAQPASRFLSLPSEIRCLIYRLVFTPDTFGYVLTILDIIRNNHSGAKQLALLATCRQVYSEAYKIAFSGTTFSLTSRRSNIPISKHLATLGPLQQHLRHVDIAMPPSKLQALSRDNPFTLMHLPLTKLKISFIDYMGTEKDWKDQVKDYYLVAGALCHVHQAEDAEGNPQGPCQPIHTLHKEKNKRRVQLQRLTYKPSRKDLHRVLGRLHTKRVVVRAYADLLYKAFLFFGLLESNSNKLAIKCADGYKYLVFYKEDFGAMGDMELGLLECCGGG